MKLKLEVRKNRKIHVLSYTYIYITMETIPDIKPIKLKEYDVKQGGYNMVGGIPIWRIVLGPSGCGKGI